MRKLSILFIFLLFACNAPVKKKTVKSKRDSLPKQTLAAKAVNALPDDTIPKIVLPDSVIQVAFRVC